MTDTGLDESTIEFQINLLAERCGSLRELSRRSGVAVGYLCRLRKGEKLTPSELILRKLGLERKVIVSYRPLAVEGEGNDG